MNQNFKNMFKSTVSSYLQIMKTLCPIKLEIFKILILYLSIFSVHGHGAWKSLIVQNFCSIGIFDHIEMIIFFNAKYKNHSGINISSRFIKLFTPGH